jgi:hypothetical protein
MFKPSTTDFYYPSSLIKAYFNWCAANDIKPHYDGMHDFISEVMGDKHINFIPKHRTIEEIFDETYQSDDE